MKQDLAALLIAREQSLHDPATRADPVQVDALLSPDFREFGSSGRAWTRAEIFALLASEPPAKRTARDFQCQPLSPTLALLTYLSSNGIRASLRSSLWRLEDDQWRILFHQGTPIPAPLKVVEPD
jgi:hypothetical protein